MINLTKMKLMIRKENVEVIMESLYLVAAMFLVVYFFLNTTTFEIAWPDNYYSNVRIFMIILVLVRAGYSQKYNLKEVILIFVISGIFLLSSNRTNSLEMQDILILILGAKGISFQKILKSYFFVVGSLLFCTVFASIFGYTENLIYQAEGRGPRMSFGIIYPTDFAAQVLYLILIYIYLRRGKLKYIELMAITLIGCNIYKFCDARLDTICIIGTVTVFLIYKYCLKWEKKIKGNKWIGEIWTSLMAVSFIICSMIMIGMTMSYSPQNKWLVWIDNLLNRRLRIGKKGIDVFGFSLWGREVPSQGMGGVLGKVGFYFFLDCSYIFVLLRYGLLVFGIVLLIWLCIGLKAKRDQDTVLLLIISIVAMHCMVEHHMLEISYNPFLWSIFADLHNKKGISTRMRLKGLIGRKAI